ncbi:hypothetical protein JYQ30_02070 [Curtobacterium flaccumfaciens pv. flaccumfaciens]|nr:hypothetical protein [Curtobacterium flaccumfaciens pv. flaccumfaciens]
MIAVPSRRNSASRQCAHRWLRWFRSEVPVGLLERSCRPRRMQTKTMSERGRVVLDAQSRARVGPTRPAVQTGAAASS